MEAMVTGTPDTITKKKRGGAVVQERLQKNAEENPFPLEAPPYEVAMKDYTTGRPTLYDAEYHPREIYRLLTMSRVHMTIRAACAYFAINPDTLYAWMKEKKEFSDAVSRARAFQEQSMAHHLTTTKYAQGTIFAMKNMHAEYWKDKIETETTVKLGDVIRDGESERNAVAWHDVIDVEQRALPAADDVEE